MTFILNDKKVPDRTVLLLDVQYENQTTDKTWSYALVKANGRWFATGGDSPTDASWAAVESWLRRSGRILKRVQIVADTREVWAADDTEADAVDGS